MAAARSERGDRRAPRGRGAALALAFAAAVAGGARAEQFASLDPVEPAARAAVVAAVHPDPPGCSRLDPEREAAFLAERVPAPRKEAWERERGGREAARPHRKERLAGWPERLFVDRAELPTDDRAFLERLAADTWRGIDALRDREHGIAIDHVRFCGGSLAARDVQIGDYTNVTNVGLQLLATVGAHELGLVDRDGAVARARHVLETLGRLERHRGFFFNYYDTTTLERTSHFVSFVDSAWLTSGLLVVRQAFPELAQACTALLAEQDYGLFYDAERGLMRHGVVVTEDGPAHSDYHYGMLYTEARLGSLIAIGKGDAPEEHWFRMYRTLPEDWGWQSQPPRGRREKTVRGHTFEGGYYEWRGMRFVPSWGGSTFEALMPLVVLDERAWAPRSLGANGRVHVALQRRFAADEAGYPVWGMSPSLRPDSIDYGEFGVPPLGVAGYAPQIVTPHAAALALGVAPAAATANLRRIASLYDSYGAYGLYDAVDPSTGAVAHAYLALDQSMIFLALANHLKDGCIQKHFAADPLVAPALAILREEDFLD
jgi:hypothetical protein